MYQMQFKYTVGQQIGILPLGIKGRVLGINLSGSGITYDVRYLTQEGGGVVEVFEDELGEIHGDMDESTL